MITEIEREREREKVQIPWEILSVNTDTAGAESNYNYLGTVRV